MKKRFIICLLTVVMFLGATPVYAFAAENLPMLAQHIGNGMLW